MTVTGTLQMQNAGVELLLAQALQQPEISIRHEASLAALLAGVGRAALRMGSNTCKSGPEGSTPRIEICLDVIAKYWGSSVNYPPNLPRPKKWCMPLDESLIITISRRRP